MSWSDRTDASLLQRLKDGIDETDWRTFLDRYEKPLYAFALGKGLRAELAEEVVQATVVEIFLGRSTFKYDAQRGRFRNYLLKVISQKISLHFRRQGQRNEAPLDEDFASQGMEIQSEFERLFEAGLLAVMLDVVRGEVAKPQTFQAFELLVVHGLSVQDVMNATGLKREDIYQAKRRVLRRLEELGASYAQDGELGSMLKKAIALNIPPKISDSLKKAIANHLPPQ